MDEESANEMVGQMLGAIFNVEDGWAHYAENFANEEGECTKEKFAELINAAVNWEKVLNETLTEGLEKVYKSCGGATEGQVDKFVKRLANKIPTYLPIFSNAIFRFFDVDGGGTISKSELVLTIGGFFGEEGPNPALALPGIFRILDADNSGSIEPVEVQPFITEIITAIAKLATAVVNELENDLKGGMRKKVLKKAQSVIDGIVENEGLPYPMPKDELLRLAGDEVGSEEMFGVASVYLEMPLPQSILDSTEATFTRFNEVAKGEPIPIKKAAEVIASSLIPSLTAFCEPEAAEAAIAMVSSQTDLPFDVEELDLSDVIPVATSVLSSYLKSGAMKRYIEAALSFLDINNDGNISEAELRSLYDGALKLKNSPDAESFKANVQAYYGAVFDIFDSDGNGTLDMDDVPKIFDKGVELGLALVYLVIEMYKTILVALVLPLLNLGFGMFTEDGSISMEMVQGLLESMN